MMRPSADEAAETTRLEFGRGPRPALYARLRDTALTGVRGFFQTALADALGIDFRQAQAIAGKSDFGDLLAALKSLELPEEQAFVIVAALYPGISVTPRRSGCSSSAIICAIGKVAADKVRGWKAASLAAAFQAPAAVSEPHRPANSAGSPASLPVSGDAYEVRKVQQVFDRRRSGLELDDPDVGIEPALFCKSRLDDRQARRRRQAR